MDILFSKQAKNINDFPEDIPESDEVEAIRQAMNDKCPNYTFDAVNWD